MSNVFVSVFVEKSSDISENEGYLRNVSVEKEKLMEYEKNKWTYEYKFDCGIVLYCDEDIEEMKEDDIDVSDWGCVVDWMCELDDWRGCVLIRSFSML